MNKIDNFVYKVEDMKAWIKKNRNLVGAGLIAFGVGTISYRLGCHNTEIAYLKFINDKVLTRAGEKGGLAFYEWMVDNVPKAAELCDEFMDSNVENGKKVLDYFLAHGYRYVKAPK